MTQKPIHIINGPNLNLLGDREPDTYGHDDFASLKARCEQKAAALGLQVQVLQSNQEGDLVNFLQQARLDASGVILNAAAYTHTSVAIHDAAKLLKIPLIEVHLSNIFAREKFRHHSYISPVATGVICGLGIAGYELALEALHDIITKA
jgi:3-dehydroquinate dehydratase-2